jgi:hypothetical protein
VAEKADVAILDRSQATLDNQKANPFPIVENGNPD